VSEILLETITDPEIAGDLIHRFMTLSRAKTPDDVMQIIQTVIDELSNYVSVCGMASYKVMEGLSSAAINMLSDVRDQIGLLKNQLGYLTSQLDYCMDVVNNKRVRAETYTHVAMNDFQMSSADIARSLVRLQQDFAGWRIERRTSGLNLIITTHSISIYDPRYDVAVDFGPFDISINLSQIARGVPKPYLVRALAPNPASSPDLPHPHVRGLHLCEGAGDKLLRKALGKGDILSFALIINQTLSTYNEMSPYAQLHAWSRRLPKGPNALPNPGEVTYNQSLRTMERRNLSSGRIPTSAANGLTAAPTGYRIDANGFADIRAVPIVNGNEDEDGDEENADYGPEGSIFVCNCCDEEHEGVPLRCSECGHDICDDCAINCPAIGRTICSACLDYNRDENHPCVGPCPSYGTNGCMVRSSGTCYVCGRATDQVRPCSRGRSICNQCASSIREDVAADTNRQWCPGCSGPTSGGGCIFPFRFVDGVPVHSPIRPRPAEPMSAPVVETGFGPPTSNSASF